jgi:hypothetical protein
VSHEVSSTTNPLPKAPGLIATRILCSAAYLDPKFVDTVRPLLVGDGLTAVGPAAGLTLGDLLQHVENARRIRAVRDWTLTLCLALAVFSVVPALTALHTDEFWQTALGSVIAFASVAAVAWTVTTSARWLQIHTATSLVRTPIPPARMARPLKPAPLAQVIQDQTSNIVCYKADAPTPFIGFGMMADTGINVRMPLTMAPHREDAGRVHRETATIDVGELYMQVRGHLWNGGVDGLNARNVLHVRGDHVNGIADLWTAGRGRRPGTNAGSVIWNGIATPGDRSHTFLAMESETHGGNLTVSMHVRFRMVHDRLSIEIASHVLAPIAAKLALAGPFPLSQSGLRSTARWQAFLDTPRQTVIAPLAILRRGLRLWAAHRARLDKLRAIRGGKFPDRGAVTSVRRWAMDQSLLRYQERVDCIDIIQRLRTGLYEAVWTFLEDAGLDTADLLSFRDAILKVEMPFEGDVASDALAYGPSVVPPPPPAAD